MSEVIENSGLPVLTAGNTVDTLASVDRDTASSTPSAAADEAARDATDAPVSDTVSVEELLDEENTFDVNRAEFNELLDLVLSLRHGIEEFNKGAPHKIPLRSINEVLGVR